jgi:hypothetical protein
MPHRSVVLLLRSGLAALIALFAAAAHAQEQIADSGFDTHVARPAYRHDGPTVAIDEAHRNFHTADGRYKPFADLLKNDGYRVVKYMSMFDAKHLSGVGVLIIANAGLPVGNDLTVPAFTPEECDVVRDWVRGGGALLLISDHAPFGAAVEALAQRFGVTVGKGWAFDRSESGEGITTQLLFSRENGLLGEHRILHGRDRSEEVTRVRSFTGQSVGVPATASALMKLSDTAGEAATPADLDAADAARRPHAGAAAPVQTPLARGRAQGIAMPFGKGRLVVVGEAAMFSAQVVRFPDGDRVREMKMGMSVPDTDDRQFALNVMHWLSGALK